MKFDWYQYFILAQELADQSFISKYDEAKLRTAISRSYYAVFCKARNYLLEKKNNVIPKDGKAHQYVIDELINGLEKEKIVGLNLKRLRGKRILADYHDCFRGNLIGEMEYSLKLAGEALSELEKLYSQDTPDGR